MKDGKAKTKTQQVIDLLKKDPKITNRKLTELVGCGGRTVSLARNKCGIVGLGYIKSPKKTKRQKCVELIMGNPEITNKEIINKVNCGEKIVCEARRDCNIPSPAFNGPVPKNKSEEYKEEINTEFRKDSGKIEVNSLTVNTLEQALEVANVDLEEWEVDRYIVNSWGVTMKLKDDIGVETPEYRTNYQVKIWLKKIIPNILEEAMGRFVEAIPSIKFPRVPKFTKPNGIAGEMCLFDAHIGKLAWGKETGRSDYDLKVSCSDYISACKKSLNFMLPFKPEKIYFIIGNDLMHIESFIPQTFKGHNILDTDSRLPKIYDKAFEAVLESVHLCRDIAPVEVLWVPGNHDQHASMFLTHAIKQRFMKDPSVVVDVSECQRKARLWGNLLIGWTHAINGRQHSWANELAQAFPKLWGESKFREWHHGHKHKKGEVKTFPTMTQGGVLMRQITALSPIDAWHFENLFTDAVPGGESFLWSKENGIIANFTAWTTGCN